MPYSSGWKTIANDYLGVRRVNVVELSRRTIVVWCKHGNMCV